MIHLRWVHLRMIHLRVVYRLGVVGMLLRQRGQRDPQRAGQQTLSRVHASTRTSRIMPASMWYSRWQW